MKNIQSPPPFKMKEMVNGAGKSAKKSRASKAAAAAPESPTKKTPARKIATPRKARTAKGRGKSTEPDAVNGETPGTVKVEVETESKPTASGDEEVEKTKVNIHMPSDHPDLELPEDAEGMLAMAREMVAEAEKIAGAAPTTAAKGKRKAAELLDTDAPDSPSVPAKRARTVDLELRKERIKRRALTGIAASLAIGYVFS